MSSVYNIDLGVVNPERNIPEVLFGITVEQFKSAGLVGEKHINNNGKLLNGYDRRCTKYLKGNFELSYVKGEQDTVREIYRKISESTVFREHVSPEESALMEEGLEMLEKGDPCSKFLPAELYYQTPLVRSMELDTAAGKQSTHVHCLGVEFHCDDGRIIYYWKPSKEDSYFDFDYLKGRAFSACLDIQDSTMQKLSDRFSLWNDLNLVNSVRIPGIYYRLLLNKIDMTRLNLLERKYFRIYNKLMKDPDSFERAPRF
jgi:hypothetical protein